MIAESCGRKGFSGSMLGYSCLEGEAFALLSQTKSEDLIKSWKEKKRLMKIKYRFQVFPLQWRERINWGDSSDEQTLEGYWVTSGTRKEVRVVLESYCIIVCQSYYRTSVALPLTKEEL